jgi:hypothetical protein
MRRSAFLRGLEDLLKAWRAGDHDRSRELAGSMVEDTVPGMWHEAAKAVPKILDDLGRAKRARAEALKGHVGKTLTIRTQKGTLRGKVVGAGPDSLQMRRTFKINNEVRLGQPYRVGIDECTAEGRKELLGKTWPASEEERIAAAFDALARGALDAARSELDRCEEAGHPLRKPLLLHLEMAARQARTRRSGRMARDRRVGLGTNGREAGEGVAGPTGRLPAALQGYTVAGTHRSGSDGPGETSERARVRVQSTPRSGTEGPRDRLRSGLR